LIITAEPSWYRYASPYYKESHKRLRKWARDLIEKEIMPHCLDWDRLNQAPAELYREFGSVGFLSGLTGHGWPSMAPCDPPVGIKPQEWDVFHEVVLCDELTRIASTGIGAVLTLGPSIALPPILYFGTKEQKEQIIKPVLSGEKSICLAITEPYAGSDVANIQATAKLSEDKQHFIVNGEKKWITNVSFLIFK
jgi:alkylation response protein AidB-like acyl-CoA dehydrogenase